MPWMAASGKIARTEKFFRPKKRLHKKDSGSYVVGQPDLTGLAVTTKPKLA